MIAFLSELCCFAPSGIKGRKTSFWLDIAFGLGALYKSTTCRVWVMTCNGAIWCYSADSFLPAVTKKKRKRKKQDCLTWLKNSAHAPLLPVTRNEWQGADNQCSSVTSHLQQGALNFLLKCNISPPAMLPSEHFGISSFVFWVSAGECLRVCVPAEKCWLEFDFAGWTLFSMKDSWRGTMEKHRTLGLEKKRRRHLHIRPQNHSEVSSSVWDFFLYFSVLAFSK